MSTGKLKSNALTTEPFALPEASASPPAQPAVLHLDPANAESQPLVLASANDDFIPDKARRATNRVRDEEVFAPRVLRRQPLRYPDLAAVRAFLSQHWAAHRLDGSARTTRELALSERFELLRTLANENLEVGGREPRYDVLKGNWLHPSTWRLNPEFLQRHRAQDLVRSLLLDTPPADRQALFERLILSYTYRPLVQKLRGEEPFRAVLNDQHVPLNRAIEATQDRLAMDDVRFFTDRFGVEHAHRLTTSQVLEAATARVSSKIAREAFPFGGDYLGISSRLTPRGDAEVFLHHCDGQVTRLTTVRGFAKDGLAKRPVELVNRLSTEVISAFIGQSSSKQHPAPPLWAALAVPYLDSVSAGQKPGAALRDVTQVSADGRRTFKMPAAAFARILQIPPNTPVQDIVGRVSQRLKALGATTSEVKALDGGVLQLDEADVELLLVSRTYNDAFRAEVGRVFQLGASEAAVMKNWEFVRRRAGLLRFEMPTEHFRQFSFIDKSAPNVRDAVSDRVAALGEYNAIRSEFMTGTGPRREVLSMAPEHARLLLKTSQFDFHPDSHGINTDNLYASMRMADVAYEEMDVVLDQMVRWGFERKNVRQVMVNGAEVVMAARVDEHTGQPYAFVISRGTSSWGDAKHDARVNDFSQLIKAGLSSKSMSDFLRRAEVMRSTMTVTFPDGTRRQGIVHAGLLSQVEGTLPGVEKALAELAANVGVADPKKLSLWMAGHSKGGAEAELMAMRLLEAGYKVVGGNTVEAMRAGGSTMVELLEAHGVDKNWVTYQQFNDFVPHVPLWSWGYRHPGIIVMPDDREDRPRGMPIWSSDPDGENPEARLRASLSAFRNKVVNHEFDALLADSKEEELPISAHLLKNLRVVYERHLLDRQFMPPVGEPTSEPAPTPSHQFSAERMVATVGAGAFPADPLRL
jgi:hypothetical protein